MKSLLRAFWFDEAGMILSAEAALLGTVGIVGATVGLSAAAHAVDAELKEMAFAFRSLDQSFSFDGQRSEFAWTAGSSYTQPPVEESRDRLRKEIEQAERKAEEQKERKQHSAPEDEKPESDHPRRRRPRKEASAEKVDAQWEIDGREQAPQAL